MREPGREPSNARDPRHTASIISGTTGTAHRVDGLSARRDAAPDPLTPRRRLVSAPTVAPALRPTPAPTRAWRVVRDGPDPEQPDRKGGALGQRGAVRVSIGGRRQLQKT